MPGDGPLDPIFKRKKRYGTVNFGAMIGFTSVPAATSPAVVTVTAETLAPTITHGAPASVTDRPGIGTSSTASSATLVFTAAQAYSVGDWIVALVSADNAGTNGASSITTMTDVQGNIYTKQTEATYDPGAASDGITLAIFTAPVTTALGTGDNQTINFSPNTASKVAAVYRVRPATGRSVVFVTAGSTTVAASNTPSISTGFRTVLDVVIGGLARPDRNGSNGDSDTVGGFWSGPFSRSADTGSNATSAAITGEYKVPNANGTQTWDPAPTGGLDNAIGYVVLRYV